MGQRTDELVHEAEMLLDLYGDSSAQKAKLIAIEKELKSRGEHRSGLYRRIDRLRLATGPDPADFRCHYELSEPLDQQEMAEKLFELTH